VGAIAEKRRQDILVAKLLASSVLPSKAGRVGSCCPEDILALFGTYKQAACPENQMLFLV